MHLHEHQSKKLLTQGGIPIPQGQVTQRATEAEAIAKQLGGPVIVKAQVLSSERGRAGGIIEAYTPQDARSAAETLLGAEIKGRQVQRVLVETLEAVTQELFIAFTYDRSRGQTVLVASRFGGKDVEASPDAVLTQAIDPLVGLHTYQLTQMLSEMDVPRQVWLEFVRIAHALYRTYESIDATLMEINPLGLTEDEHLVALDAKIRLDDNALFRQPALAQLYDPIHEHRIETQARAVGIRYVKLDGQIGCLVNGAGLAMTTMDLIGHYGQADGIRAANFLDIGGGAQADHVADALRIILADTDLRCVLVNIFGGITRCDEVAEGIISVCRSTPPNVPFVVRMRGSNADEGCLLIDQVGIPNLYHADSLSDAAQQAVAIVRRLNYAERPPL